VIFVGHDASGLTPILVADPLMVELIIEVDLVDVLVAQTISLAVHLDQELSLSPCDVFLLVPFPRVLSLEHSSALASDDGNSVALERDDSSQIVPLSLAKGVVSTILKV